MSLSDTSDQLTIARGHGSLRSLKAAVAASPQRGARPLIGCLDGVSLARVAAHVPGISARPGLHAIPIGAAPSRAPAAGRRLAAAAVMPHPAERHAAQLYERPEFLHRAIATFFAEEPRRGAMAMVSRPDTFEAVCERLALAFDCAAADLVNRVVFVDVHTALQGFMEEGKVNLSRAEAGLSSLLDTVIAYHPGGPIRIYGEMADVLCSQGNHSSAIQLEALWNSRFGDRGVSVLCGYALAHFDEDEEGTCLRAVCGEHILVAPTETLMDVMDVPDDRSRLDHLVSLQQRARQRALRKETPPTTRFASATGVICLIDDEPSVRRSLVRLLEAVGLRVKAYPSAEAFVAELHQLPVGCIIADVQLPGMSGLELQEYLQGTGLPTILISGSSDPRVEVEALRGGASDFLRKPFPAERLFDAIKRALG